jgi:uncharacterized protein YaaR (DUF327 family)
MKNKSLFILFLLSLSGILFSCAKKEDDCATAYTTELQAEVNAINTTGQAYAQNPTPANCLAYKAAAQAYVNALEPYGNCASLTGQSRTNFETSLTAARTAVNSLTC